MENLVLSNISNSLSAMVYSDYTTIEDDDNFPVVIKQSNVDYLVEDIMLDSKYHFPKKTVETLEENQKFESDEIFNLLVIIYRAYDSYNETLTMQGQNNVEAEELEKGKKDQEDIVDVLVRLMDEFDYMRIARTLQSKTDEEIVDLFYFNRRSKKDVVQILISEIKDEYGFEYKRSIWN